jgi:glycerol-3-phosphate acyltransferase PlsX
VFLGLNGIAVKSHGGTDAFGFANAISVAVDMVQQDFLEQSKDILNSLAVESDSKKAAAV